MPASPAGADAVLPTASLAASSSATMVAACDAEASSATPVCAFADTVCDALATAAAIVALAAIDALLVEEDGVRVIQCHAPNAPAPITHSATSAAAFGERAALPAGAAGGTTRPSRFARIREPLGVPF